MIEQQEETFDQDAGWDPGQLLDALIRHLNLKNDRALSRRLAFHPARINKIRHGWAPCNTRVLRRIQEISGLDFAGLSTLMMKPEEEEGFDPNKLLDALLTRLNLNNDLALARELDITPSSISKIRHGKLVVGAPLLIRMHELSGLKVRELRALMGGRRRSVRR
jgi:plasmid maintenance system antidote protein VapI